MVARREEGGRVSEVEWVKWVNGDEWVNLW